MIKFLNNKLIICKIPSWEEIAIIIGLDKYANKIWGYYKLKESRKRNGSPIII